MSKSTSDNVGGKRMRISEKVFQLWFIGMLFYLGMFVLFGVTNGCAVLAAVLLTGMMVAAMYGSVMMDMKLDHAKAFRVIQWTIGLIVAGIVIVAIAVTGGITGLFTIEGLISVVVLIACSEFLIIVGSNMMISVAYCMADIQH